MKKKYRGQTRNTDYSAYRHPRWWPTWAEIAVMWCVAQLPIRFQWWLGKRAGLLAWRFARGRRRIAEVNIRLCFPEFTRSQQDGLARDLRGLFRSLRNNRTVWYATDQDCGCKDIVFAPFFGIPAGTITATSRIAARSHCKVVPFSHFRRDDKPGYDIYFHPALEPFPSGDDLQDATVINQILEREIRRAPDQYLWMHRRFKTRPDIDDPGFYGDK